MIHRLSGRQRAAIVALLALDLVSSIALVWAAMEYFPDLMTFIVRSLSE